MTIEQKAITLAAKQGWQYIKSVKLSHPADSYMIYTLVKIEDANGITYATHLFNEELGEAGAFNYGHYDFKTLEAAQADLKGRL